MTKGRIFDIIRQYYNDYYTGAKIKEESIENSYIKLELETKIVTLSYNEKTNSIDEKDRARRGMKKKDDNSFVWNGTIQNLNDKEQKKEPIEKPKRHRRTKVEIEAANIKSQNKTDECIQLSIFDTLIKEDDNISISENEKIYEKIPEGAIVKNNYSKKDYRVVKISENNLVEVFDKDHGYLTFARADIEVMVNITRD